MDEHTLFGIMSTTKAMTTAGIALLVEDGVLPWDDPVTKWVPEFAMPDHYVTRELTVLDLVTHRAGLADTDLLQLRWDLDDEGIFRRVRDLEPAYSFRAGYVSPNIMFGLAGHVIERASGMTWAAFLHRRPQEPLGVTRTFCSWRAVAERGGANVSAPHEMVADTVTVITEDPADAIPAAGAVWSTAADMARWMRFLLDSARVGEERLLCGRKSACSPGRAGPRTVRAGSFRTIAGRSSPFIRGVSTAGSRLWGSCPTSGSASSCWRIWITPSSDMH